MKKMTLAYFGPRFFFYVLENFQGLIIQFDVGLSISIVFSFTSYLLGLTLITQVKVKLLASELNPCFFPVLIIMVPS